jgi:hypothetical protein
MKFFLFIFTTAFLLIANPLFGQLKNSSPTAISDNVMVRMQKGADPGILSQLVPSHFELKVQKILSQHSDIWLLNFNDENTDVKEVVATVQKINSVLYAQPNREVELRAAPNDPSYGSQWQHDNIDSELAWDITTGGTTANGTEIVVALIESADIINHPDLMDNQWVNTAEIPNNGVDDDGNGYIDDYNGWNVSTDNDNIGAGTHGTSCAGMIGAKGNNGIGVSGINWDVKIMDIAGYANPFTEANIVEAYNYALSARILWNQTNGASGAFVVATSASWGADGGDPINYPIWCSFYDDLGQAGILNAGATTNQNQDVDTFGDVPTGCASNYMIGVTATNQSDIIDFAGYGDQTINVAAPGSSIYTTAQNGGYTTTSGTSFACPLTAGLIGLMYSAPCNDLEQMALSNPQGTADIVREALYNGVDQSTHLIQRTISGGRINAKNSIDLLMTEVCSSCAPPSNINVSSINDYEASITYDLAAEADSYTIYLQVAGSGNWLTYTSSNSNFTFTGLTNCTEYEFYISSDCAGEISSPSFTTSFNTSGCGNCVDLNYCETTANNPVVDLMVNSPATTEGSYTYVPTSNFGGDVENGYVYGELVLVDDGTANPNEGCSPLVNGAAVNGNIAVVYRGACPFTDKAINAQNAGATAVIIINNVATAPIDMGGTNNSVTIPAVMISQADGATLVNSINNNEQPTAILGQQNEWIDAFEIDGNVFTTGDDNGYRWNDNPITLTLGQNYPFTLTPGYDGQALEEYTRVWLDLNQDGLFDNSEIIYDQGAATTTVLNDAFTIPASAALGSTRMRVQMAYQGFDNSTLPDVCGDYFSGETEDFCVNLISGISCGMTISSNVINPVCNELQNGEISLSVTDGAPAFTYLWNTGATSSNISNLGPNNYSVIITDVNGCDTTVSFPLSFTSQLALNETLTKPSCPQSVDGMISVNATGGNNFTYNWNNGPSNSDWSGIGVGNYSLTATDDLGCQISKNYNLTAPNVPSPSVNYTADNYFLTIEFSNNSTNGNSYLWDFGDGNTSTNVDPTHTYADEGNYNVCLTVYGDCDTVNFCKNLLVEKDNTGLSDEAIQNGINIYPNPAKDIINIIKISNSPEQVIIYNTNGQLINKIHLPTNSTVLNVNEWKPGVYFFHILNEKGEFISTRRISVIP